MKKVVYTIFTIVILAAVITFVTGGTFLQDLYDTIMDMINSLFGI